MNIKDIMKRMAANGWDVRPSVGKECTLKGWNKMDKYPGPAEIEAWPDMLWSNVHDKFIRWSSCGIRLDEGLVAIDVDIDDAHLARKIEDVANDILGPDAWGDVLIRDSERASFMFLVRTDHDDITFKRWSTADYTTVDSEGKQAVEIYTGAHGGKFFGCYGPHSVDSDGAPVRMYNWVDEKGPKDTRPDQLVHLPWATIERLAVAISDCMDVNATRIKETAETSTGVGQADRVYDIEGDETFDVKGWGAMTYEEVVEALGRQTERMTASYSWFDGLSHDNRTRCVLNLTHDNELAVFDFATGITHMREGTDDRTEDDRRGTIEALGEALRQAWPDEVQEAMEAAAEAGADVEEFEAKIEELMETLAWDYRTGACYRIQQGEIWTPVSFPVIKQSLARFDLRWEGPRGGQRRYSPADAWRASEDKIEVGGVRFRPDEPRVFKEGASTYLNAFFRWDQPDSWDQEAQDWLDDFMHHLVPDDEERAWLWEWMADKYQNPHHRNCAVVFIAPGIQGAGRGTLFSILDKALGGYTNVVSESDLLGARFNAFMENSLVVFCNELGGAGWTERKRGYETLKDRVDPSHSMVTIERKGIEAYRTQTFSSFMLATNNPGALTMDAEDRRFAIITNGKQLKGDLLERFKRIGRSALAYQMRRELAETAVTMDVVNAPAFAGREEMLTAGDTDLDDAIRQVIDGGQPWRAWIRSDFDEKVKLIMTGSSTSRVPGLRNALTGLVGRRAERMGAWCLPKKVFVGDKSLAVIAKQPDVFFALSPDDRVKVVAGQEPDWDGTNVVPFDK